MRILDNDLENPAEVMKALADVTRLRVLNLLIERECCVCEVVQALGISQTRASRNLSQLYQAGLLEYRRDGPWTIYYLSPETGAGYRKLVVEAVDLALADSDLAAADRRRLRQNGRLCPPSSTGEPAEPAEASCPPTVR
ncbi:metalloregulator ArsR/SmtB family transcription factor [Dehalogenimonas sp. 4OHTPN]|uniref:Metalloregulator ArsR/SmtB family transcription factor n=1 Tax=Dehalogenimonas sp. 4OHTPN TaxID=3166643 RepID=A0AAU8G8J9_9CHLR